jgi:hypothetical protein
MTLETAIDHTVIIAVLLGWFILMEKVNNAKPRRR